MYTLLLKKKSGQFNIVNNKLLYSYHKLFYDDEVIYNGNTTSFSLFKSTLFLIDNYKKLVVLDLKDKTIKEYNFINGIDLIINNKEIIYGNWNKNYTKRYLTRFNLITNKQKWEIESYFGNGKILDNLLYTTCINKNICKIDLNHPESPLWQLNLEQLGSYEFTGDVLAYKVVHFIGIWQNKLLVQLSNSRIIALDVNTGKLLHNIEFNKTNPLTAQGVYYDQFIKMHLADNKIIWLNNQTLLQVDLNTFKTKTIKEYYSPPRQNQWRFMHNTYFEGKLYFTADYAWQYVTPSYVGVMDANTGEVLWSQQLKNTGGLPEAPKVTNNKLYIRTNTGILHIFEKTVNETT